MSDWLAPFEPTRGKPFDRAAAVHLLRRACLGHPPELVERCLTLGPLEAARSLVAGEAPDARERRVAEQLPAILASEDGEQLAGWWWAMLLVSRHPLRARLGLFWHDHFATSVRKVKSSYWMRQQLAAFEAHGLGEFKTLLAAVARGPAMLRWLDGEANRKGRANENFARELLELFTLGRGAYTEADVQEAARAFTGWRIAREAFYFDRGRHDAGEKTVLGQRGNLSGDDVLALAAGREECARFLAGKLAAAFVGPSCPPEAVAELAALLGGNGGHIGKALEVLLASRVFYSREARGSRIRGPVEWLVWMLRTLECTAAPLALHAAAGRMGQKLLDPPDVSGWAEEAAWLSSASWVARGNLAGHLGQGGEPFWLRPALAERVAASMPKGEVEWLVDRLFPEGMVAEARRVLEAQAQAEVRVPREVRLAALLRACLMLPGAHRF